MSLKWQRVVQEKLFLAETLLRQADGEPDQGSSAGLSQVQCTALVQGAIALMLNASAVLLVLVAQLNQQKVNGVGSLDELCDMLGDSHPDAASLLSLSKNGAGWWYRLEMLANWLRQPTEAQKPKAAGEHSDSNSLIIAVADNAPETTPTELLALVAEMKAYVAELCRRHDEW